MKHSFLFIQRIALFIVTYVIMTQPASAANTTDTGFDPSSLPGTVVYVEGKEFAYFVAPTSWSNCNVWTWSHTTGTNYTQSGVWPGDPITFVGNTTDGSPVYQWIGPNIVENDRPTGIIFNNGSTQTADLVYVAGGVYNLNGNLLYTVSGSSTVVNGLAYQINSDGVSVTLVYNDSYKTINDAVTIPKNVTIDGQPYTVTAIGNGAFYDCTGLTAVTIPNSVKTIGNGAFSGCSGLTTMAIPNSVTSIGGNAFYNCTGLTSVTIPNSVTTIGGNAFESCTSLISVTIPNSVTTIGDCAFYRCLSLTSVAIPNSLTKIGDRVFYYCYNLTSVTIPNSVTYIGVSAFAYCSGLTSLSIPGSIRTIYSSSFMGCSGLTSIHVDSSNSFYDSRDNCNAIIQTSNNTLILGCKNTIIPNSVTSIGDYAFDNCWRLSSITIPNSVTNIGVSAFAYCSGLTSLSIPGSVRTIYSSSFMDCSGLTSIHVDSSNSFYDSRDNCNAIIKTSNNTLILGCNSTFIPNSVTSIGDYAFYHCWRLSSITIPNSVTSIDDYAFAYCNFLTSINSQIENPSIIDMGNDVFSGVSSNNNCILYVPSGTLNLYKATDQWKDFANIIDNAIIANGLLFNKNEDDVSVTVKKCLSSGDIVIPNSINYGGKTYSVTSIGDNAFSDCTGLTDVTIPNSVTSIGFLAFWGCSGLTAVTIPNSVTTIGNSAFYYCTSLTSIIVEAGNTKYDSRNNCNAIIEKATNTLLYGCQNSIIPNSVTSIGNSAFVSCTGLTSITIPNSVTTIGYAAFNECTGLTSVTIPNSVTSIGEGAFYYCTGLTSIKSKILKPENVSMGYSVFYDVNKINCKLYVPQGTSGIYQNTPQWSEFTNIEEVPFTPGDVNYDDVCTASDVTALYNYILYNDEGAIVIGDQNGDGSITASDVTAVYNIILGL